MTLQDIFKFTDEEFLVIINMILRSDTPIGDEFFPITDMEDSFNVRGLDSLSTMMFFIWICEFFGITEKQVQKLMEEQPDFSVRTLKNFVTKECTRTFSYSQAKAYSKHCFDDKNRPN
jgi:hypothetical protein